MTDNWTRADIDKLSKFDSEDLVRWLRSGLLDWDDKRLVWKAFDPVQDRFHLREDPEPQIADMFGVMMEHEKQTFVSAISRGFARSEPEENGYRFFDSLARIMMLIKRTEPLRSMVDRISDPLFLSAASADVANHLYATAFLVLDQTRWHPDTPHLVARLITSSLIRPAYVPKILEILTANSRTVIPLFLRNFQRFLRDPAIRASAIKLVSESVRKMGAMQVIDLVGDTEFVRVMESSGADRVVLAKGLTSHSNALTEELLATHNAEAQDPIQQLISNRYLDLPNRNRSIFRQITMGSAAARVHFTAQFEDDVGLAMVAKFAQEREAGWSLE
jgi:hypothetical protein